MLTKVGNKSTMHANIYPRDDYQNLPKVADHIFEINEAPIDDMKAPQQGPITAQEKARVQSEELDATLAIGAEELKQTKIVAEPNISLKVTNGLPNFSKRVLAKSTSSIMLTCKRI